MVGGEKVAFEKCLDIHRALSEKVFYLGPSGSGAKAKLASNLILGLNRLVLAEGLIFAEELGLDLEPFLELLKVSPAYSVSMDGALSEKEANVINCNISDERILPRNIVFRDLARKRRPSSM